VFQSPRAVARFRARLVASAVVPALAAVAAMVTAAPAGAQTFPDRPVRFIIPFSAGGVTDVVARPPLQKLQSLWGQPGVAENRPGAGSTIGADLVAKAKPDGYTLLLTGSTHLVGAALHAKSITFHPIDDFTPILHMAEQGSALVVHPSVPAKNVAELIALAKAQPGKLNYASSGNGSSQHLFAALFCTMSGIQMTHVPYKGSGPAIADLLSGLVPVSIPSISNIINHAQAGKLRVLATTGAKRAQAMPDVPTLAEAGVKGYDATLWFALLGPKGMPPALVKRVQDVMLEALKSPEVLQAYQTQGIEVRTMGPSELGTYMRAESVKWARVVKESGATVD
jgi:tripartite-type tricarboxylate transporter receptor subunit TctC